MDSQGELTQKPKVGEVGHGLVGARKWWVRGSKVTCGPRAGLEDSLEGWQKHSAVVRSGFAWRCLGEQGTEII